MTLVTLYFANVLGSCESVKLDEIKAELLSIPNKIEAILKNTESIANIAKSIFKEHDVFYLGRGIDYATALEASLKLKEISYIHSESYAAGELKHGTIADRKSVV